jgi:hypothetical protein
MSKIDESTYRKQNLRHKWVKDHRGRYCIKCGSRVNTESGFPRYIEYRYGSFDPVDWYPRCYPDEVANEQD